MTTLDKFKNLNLKLKLLIENMVLRKILEQLMHFVFSGTTLSFY